MGRAQNRHACVSALPDVRQGALHVRALLGRGLLPSAPPRHLRLGWLRPCCGFVLARVVLAARGPDLGLDPDVAERRLDERQAARDRHEAVRRDLLDALDVERGQVIAAPGSISPHTKFSCEAYILTKEEGGRHTPFFSNYRPQFYFRTTDVTGSVVLPDGTEMVMPGDNISMEVNLIAPIAMDEGLRFAIREGGRTVGAGVVSKVIE